MRDSDIKYSFNQNILIEVAKWGQFGLHSTNHGQGYDPTDQSGASNVSAYIVQNKLVTVGMQDLDLDMHVWIRHTHLHPLTYQDTPV